jgi:hypothetical protein
LRDQYFDDPVAFVWKLILGGVGDEGFPMTEMPVLRGRCGFVPFAKEIFAVIGGDKVVDWGRRGAASEVVEKCLGFWGS